MADDEGAFKRWHYKTERALRVALDEYSMFTDNVTIARYAPPSGRGYHDDKDVSLRVLRQNAEIDRRMLLLEEAGCTFYFKLLDRYYRQGLNQHNQGWKAVAGLCGLARSDEPRDYTNFTRCLHMSTTYLFLVGT